MSVSTGNLFDQAQPPASGERFEVLGQLGGVELERVISSDSPESLLYTQAWPEWVVLLKGGADLEVAGARLSLAPGDYVHLPAGVPHRVLSTESGTVWLALHAKGDVSD